MCKQICGPQFHLLFLEFRYDLCVQHMKVTIKDRKKYLSAENKVNICLQKIK